MHIFSHFDPMSLKTLEELKAHVAHLPHVPSNYKVAVGSLIFDHQNRVILIERSGASRDSIGKLEGVGGGVDSGETDLHKSLQREIKEEIGDLEIRIDDLLTVLTLPGEADGLFWVIPIYLCRLTAGEPVNKEPHKCAAIHRLALAEVDDQRLSAYQKITMAAYREKFGERPYDERRVESTR